MTEPEIRKVVEEAVRSALSDPALHCRYQQDPEQHSIDHAAIRQFIETMGRVDDLKFGIVKWMMISTLTLIFGWAGYGLIHKMAELIAPILPK
jgi:hypothetical protein